MADALADDVLMLDLTTLTWSALPPQFPPMPQLCRHSMAATGTVAMAGPPDTAAITHTFDDPSCALPSAASAATAPNVVSLQATDSPAGSGSAVATGTHPSDTPPAAAGVDASAAAAVTAVPLRTSTSAAEAAVSKPATDACQPGSCSNDEEAIAERETVQEAEALPSIKVDDPTAAEAAVWVFGGFDGLGTRGELIRLQLPAALAAHRDSDSASGKVCTSANDRT